MAATKTKKPTNNTTKKTQSAPKVSTPPVDPAIRKRNIRLALGFICLLLGSFFTLSIISYCFTWQEDQNHLISSQGSFNFLFPDKSPVEMARIISTLRKNTELAKKDLILASL